MSDSPFISIVIPCRNEDKFIRTCLDSIFANDYPKDRLEVLVVDGMSEDGTRAILDEYLNRYPFIRVLPNPKRVTPVAFNIGIRQARGDLIMIMSAHATLGKDAIAQCATFSNKYDADNVGGVWKIHPRNNGLLAKAVVCALSHPFGVGRALYRTISQTETEPRWVDTAAYGCYKREVFERIGTFNERLVRGQDAELNRRLAEAGGKTLLVPGIVINYYARSDFHSFCKHNFRNGVWAVLPFAYSNVMPVSWRHLTPLAFVTGLIGSAFLGLLVKPFWWLFGAAAAAYGAANLGASAQVARRQHNLKYLAIMPWVFATLHIGYGLGSLWGVIKLVGASEFWNRLVGFGWRRAASAK